ncbi:hypothetical protein AB6A40_007723 [Gnathostoma spinigerum]|uniref:Twinfilin n=1 Tax=Gnathostoma spinigerum TaxID=75299 RepID=A0ABD6EM29_9BILA
MACQSGIRGDDRLQKVLSGCKDSSLRLAKIVIKDEKLTANFEDKGSTDWEADWCRTVLNCIDAFEPCFLLFRLDSSTSWVLISFADDRAPVREKMLLASTRATFKAEFGQCNIRYEYHATNKNDLTLQAFKRWMNSRDDPAPLSELEKELGSAYEKQKYNLPLPTAAQSVKGVDFPVDQGAMEVLRDFAEGKINYVQLSVDTLNEAIKLEMFKENIDVEQLQEIVPYGKPRYHFYRFSHEFDGKPYNSIVFIYSLPTSGCTIKERMLYSSCKSPFLQTVTTSANFTPDKKIEMDSREKITRQSLIECIHPILQDGVKGFAKPPGPTRRNGRHTH